MYNFIFTKNGEKEFLKLDKKVQERVLKKLKILKNDENISHYLRSLIDMFPATHRLRIGSIRIILHKIDDLTFHILDVGNRGDIYK